MNVLDPILLVPLLWGAYRGFQKGLIHEVTTFVALFAGVYGALHYSGIAEPYLKPALGEEQEYLPLIAFGVTFVALLIGTHLLGRLLDRIVKWMALGLVNRILGGLFGLLKVALFLCALLIMLRTYGPSKGTIIPQKVQKNSLLLTYLEQGTSSVMRYDLDETWPGSEDTEA
ncbi:MAG: CvpA family protein [Flavobacteriales bacterium]